MGGKKGKKQGKEEVKKGKKQGKEEVKQGKLKACNQVKARHILCEKQSKLLEAYDSLSSEHGNKPPVSEFSRLAEQFSECPSARRGGDLGWFPRGRMVGEFQEVAFSLEPGTMSQPFRTREGYHIVFVEGRKA